MFTIHCPRQGVEVLLWPTNVDAVRNTDEGIEVAYHCHCGYRGILLTGRFWEQELARLPA